MMWQMAPSFNRPLVFHTFTEMILRPAVLEDAEMLLAWRNDPATRSASHDTAEVPLGNHLRWLVATLSNPDRMLMVAEVHGIPVGTVRSDRDGDICELSWTIAPSARGEGFAKQMVKMFADSLHGKIRAEIREGNVASVQVAEAAGMTLDSISGGVLHFSR